MHYNASCHCGAIHLRISGEPMAQYYCHCDDCQSVHGAGYVPYSLYPSNAVSIVKGAPTSWALKTSPRSFCAQCGTRLFAETPGHAVCGVNAYLLPAGHFNPQFHLQCRYAVLPVKDNLPHFVGVPTRFGGSNDELMNW